MENIDKHRFDRFGKKWFRVFLFSTFTAILLLFVIGPILRITEDWGYHNILDIYGDVLFFVIVFSFDLGLFFLLSGNILVNEFPHREKYNESIADSIFIVGLLFFIVLVFILLLLVDYFRDRISSKDNLYSVILVFSILFSISMAGIMPKLILNYYNLQFKQEESNEQKT